MTMAVAYALMDRFIVEITVAPLDSVRADKDLQNSAGSATCSITWIACEQSDGNPTSRIQVTKRSERY